MPKFLNEAEFVCKYSHYSASPEEVAELLREHAAYKTLIVLKDAEGIAAVCRFNVEGETAHVLDLVIRPDAERKGLIRYVTCLGWSRFPFLKFVSFERLSKYPYRTPRAYSISKLLGRK